MLKRKTKSAEEVRRARIEKERKNRRKAMLKTKYGRKPERHAKKGIQSCIEAGVGVFLLLLILILSFVMKGKLGIIAGFIGIVILCTGVHGLRTGMRGLNERDKNYITCKFGIGINGAILLGIAIIFIRGLI